MVYTKIFVPQRTQPPHIGHISLLEAAAAEAEHVVIGIGSANKHDALNPYTANERQQMLEKSLHDVGVTNYSFVHLDDCEKDEDWVAQVRQKVGLDTKTAIVSGNPWVADIFAEQTVLKPQDLLGQLIPISGTELRKMIVTNDPRWQTYAATGTKHYFEQFGGAQRLGVQYELA